MEVDSDCQNVIGVGRNCCQCGIGLNAKLVNKTMRSFSTSCQALTLIYREHTVSETQCKVICCSNVISDTHSILYRASISKPFAALCERHVELAKAHHQCPMCGYFCEYGNLLLCKEKDNPSRQSNHLMHLPCVPNPSTPTCLHCNYNVEDCVKTNRRLHIVYSDIICSEYRDLHYPPQPVQERTRSISSGSGIKILRIRKDNSPHHKKNEDLHNELSDAVDILEDKVANLYCDEFNLIHLDLGLYLFNDLDSRHQLLSHFSKRLSLNRERTCTAGGDNSWNSLSNYVKSNDVVSLVDLLTKRAAQEESRIQVERDCDLLFNAISYAASPIIISIILQLPWISINRQNAVGKTCLMLAVEKQDITYVKQVIAAGADINVQDKEKRTVIMIALHMKSDMQIINLLLASPVIDLALTDDRNQNLIDYALTSDNATAYHILLDRFKILGESKSNNFSSYTSLADFPNISRAISQGFSENNVIISDLSNGFENRIIPCYNEIDNSKAAPPFVYKSERIVSPNFYQDSLLTSLKLSCSCVDVCSAPFCECIMNSSGHTYTDDGRLDLDLLGEDEEIAIFECNSNCSCSISCQHRVVQNGIQGSLHVFKTRDRGWGARAGGQFKRGQFVAEYIGEVIPDNVAETRVDSDTYLFDLKDMSMSHEQVACIDAKYMGNVARFFNHLCAPNLNVIYFFTGQCDVRIPQVAFFANRDILCGEELGFDYGYQFWRVKYKEFLCECGSPSCKYNSASKIKKMIKELKNLED